MSAAAPWSVKGIDPKAREVAKDLARRSGMTLGEWLNTMIMDDADEDEWVLLIEGEAILEFTDGRQHHLHRGDHLLIPAHCQHKVAWTPVDRTTIWLAVHF